MPFLVTWYPKYLLYFIKVDECMHYCWIIDLSLSHTFGAPFKTPIGTYRKQEKEEEREKEGKNTYLGIGTIINIIASILCISKDKESIRCQYIGV